MKLTNISLAVLVALGLVACGGSDDNNNQTTDPKPPKEIPGDGGNGGDGGTPPKGDKSALDPERVAPDLTVPKDLQTDVNVSKAAYLSRGFADSALGYDNGRNYKEKQGTDPADIKFTSIYNFLDAGDVMDSKSSSLGKTAEGAIYVSEDPQNGAAQNAYVKIGSKYYRVKADFSTSGGKYTPDTKYMLVAPFKLQGSSLTIDDTAVTVPALKKLYEDGEYAITSRTNNTGKKYFKQSDVVFIANVDLHPWPDSGKATQVDADKINKSLVIELGEESNFADKTGQTVLHDVSFLGNHYSPSATGQSLDFSSLPVNNEQIQFVDVSSSFTISNDKNNSKSGDDFSVSRDVDLGKVKAYNLPYSIAFVTVNPSKENAKNIFNLDSDDNSKLTNGSYQVRGYQTIALPKQGRAFYTGKSFNASVEGDIKLTADFFEDRAGVQGTVTNRRDVVKNKALPNLRLDLLTLTDPKKHGTYAETGNGEGKVHGDPKVDSWSVQFYGLEAQEAGGKLYGSNYEEVYTTQRGRLTNLSNTSDVK